MSYRRVVQNAYGEPKDVLELRTEVDPSLELGQVAIRMESAALHIADLYNIRGVYGFEPPLPRTPGFEGVGLIAQVGPGVSSELVGQRVFAPRGSGCLSELVIAEADNLLPAPGGDSDQLALTVINGATALALVDDFVRLGPGDWLVQNAANSNCGRYVIVLAKERGLRTVNVVRRPELIGELEDLGADVVLLDGPDLPDRVAEATGSSKIKLGLDAVAGEATARIADCLADGGLVVNYGAVTRENCQMSFYTMFRRDIRLCGMSMLRQMETRSLADQRASLLNLAQLISDGVLQASIAAHYSLDDYLAALHHAGETGTARSGKIIVRPNN